MLREELGPTRADLHVPLVKGGVQLHKPQGVMHDTANIDGDDEEPTRTECVDLYVENALDKFKAYVFKLQQRGKPSTRLT
jgi:hypothetical protein